MPLPIAAAAVVFTAAFSSSFHGATVPLQNPVITGTLALSQSVTTGFIPWANISTGGTISGVSTITAPSSAGVQLLGGSWIVNENANSLPGLAGLDGSLLENLGAANGVNSRDIIDAFSAFSILTLRRAQGTASSPSAVVTGNLLGAVGAIGYDGSAYGTMGGGYVYWGASQTWTTSAMGAYMGFDTTALGATVASENMRLQPSGGLTLGNLLIATDPGQANFLTSGTIFINQTGGTLPAALTGTMIQAGSAAGTTGRIVLDSFAANNVIDFRRADNTVAMPTGVLNGENLGSLGWRGYGATGYSATSRATLVGQATQGWTDTAQGTALIFSTTPNGSITPGAVLTLGQDASATFAGALSGITTLGMSGALTATGNIQSSSGNLIASTGNLSVGGTSSFTGAITSGLNVTGGTISTSNEVIIGTGIGSNTELLINGGTASGFGPYLNLQKNGSFIAQIGALSAITGSGTNSDLALYIASGDNLDVLIANTQIAQVTSSGLNISSGKSFQTGTAYVSSTFTTGTGSIDIKDSTGTTYHVICHN